MDHLKGGCDEDKTDFCFLGRAGSDLFRRHGPGAGHNRRACQISDGGSDLPDPGAYIFLRGRPGKEDLKLQFTGRGKLEKSSRKIDSGI